MSKKISITGYEARNKAIKGLNYVADSIETTIGPFGQNFLLEKGNKVTNDGYLISAELCQTIPDEFERRGALVAHEASAKTNDLVGDATSTAWSLTKNIVKEAVRYLPNEKSIKAKKTPTEMIQMINKSKDNVISELEKMSTPILDKEQLVKSALVSVEDESIARLLGEMQFELGPEGVITAEEVNESECSIERVKGIKLDNGFSSSSFITNPEKMSLEVSEVSVLLTNYTMGKEELLKLKDSVFVPLLNQKKMACAVFARAFTSEAIQYCNESLKTGFTIFPINAPYTDQAEVMRDISAVTGAKFIDTEGSSFDDIHVSDVGFAKKLVAQQFGSLITGVDDEVATKRISERVETLKKAHEGSQSDFQKKMIETRMAQLSNGFAILKVGSHSVTDRQRLKDKCDDAVNAVRLALKGGTVKGGGQAFKEIADNLPEDDILKRPLTCIYDKIMNSAPEGFKIEEWVRDPFLVLKTSLEQSCAFAGTFSSTAGIITTKDKKEKSSIEDEE